MADPRLTSMAMAGMDMVSMSESAPVDPKTGVRIRGTPRQPSPHETRGRSSAASL